MFLLLLLLLWLLLLRRDVAAVTAAATATAFSLGFAAAFLPFFAATTTTTKATCIVAAAVRWRRGALSASLFASQPAFSALQIFPAPVECSFSLFFQLIATLQWSFSSSLSSSSNRSSACVWARQPADLSVCVCVWSAGRGDKSFFLHSYACEQRACVCALA